MSNIANVQIFGVPIVAYGLIAVTTGVLAYATAAGALTESVSNPPSLLTSIVETPTNAINSIVASPEEPAAAEEPSAPPADQVTGGKKHKRKTPKLKRKGSKRKNGTKNSHK